MKNHTLTFELRYDSVKSDGETEYKTVKYALGEFLDFNEAVNQGNQFIELLNLDHSSTPGINGDRLGTRIMGTIKKTTVRNYLRCDKGIQRAEIFIHIDSIDHLSISEALIICNNLKKSK